ncbi:YL1 nuclear protein [Babesia caballi]|uniref:YL1 nuclear protein n=1 Tax=Babesia caballi TaxID=5871 RepID=A0AAV4M008_BABCB|nr:YL1 nuclear protein [Babesia caballi]
MPRQRRRSAASEPEEAEEEPELETAAEGDSEDYSSEQEEDEDEDEDSEDESSFDEMSVGVALELPRRENRGKKYTKLVGEELEKDQQFWGHATWEEEAVDEDYNCSEGEEQYAYSTDSDFDDPETDVGFAVCFVHAPQKSDEEVDESQFKERKKKTRGTYVDPALRRSKLVRKAVEKQTADKRRGEEGPRPKRQAPPPAVVPVDRSVRASTKWKTEAANELERRRDTSKVESGAAAAQKKAPAKKRLTQEQLMAMALKTEAANARSLESLKAWEDEKKQYDEIKKWNYKGNYDIWVCWNSLLSVVNKAADADPDAPPMPSTHVVEKPLELYMFTSGKAPEYYTEQEAARLSRRQRRRPRCAITGRPARYVDPLTGHYYSGGDTFNILRMLHHDKANRRLAAELNHIEKMLDNLPNLR